MNRIKSQVLIRTSQGKQYSRSDVWPQGKAQNHFLYIFNPMKP
jgi:hypothetical protein